jgi:hypothetical protein
MAKTFQLPRDFYYWGQNRLGSLLPMVASLFGRVFPVHTLYICSFVQYAFLFTGFYLISTQLKSPLLKIAICAVIFMPVNEYIYLVELGHPYSSQLFAGSIFIYMCSALRKYLLANRQFGLKQLLISVLLSFGSSFFFLVGIWVSEFNAVLVLIPMIFILKEKELRTIILERFRNIYFIIFELLLLVLFISTLHFYKLIKANGLEDEAYNKVFLDNAQDIGKNVDFFLARLKASLLFTDPHPFENFFNWYLIIFSGIIFVILKTNKRVQKSTLIYSLLVVCTVSTIMLFCSIWNLRSDFRPRYFTPVYIIFCFILLLFADQAYFKKYAKFVVSLLFVFFGVVYCYSSSISKKFLAHLNCMVNIKNYQEEQ